MMAAPSCCATPKVGPGAKFCASCGTSQAPPVDVRGAGSPGGEQRGYPTSPQEVGAAVPTRTPTRTESTNSRGVSPDRRSNGSDNRANGYGGHSASGWLEPRDMFHEDTQWEALPFERQMEASRPPGIDAVTCLMCGYLCSANMSSCPECDNAMGGDGGGGAPQLAPTPTDLAQFNSAQIVSSRSSLGSETSCDINSEDTSELSIAEVLSEKAWYEGPMSRADAETALSRVAIGSFLLRQRLNSEGLALAQKTSSKIRHYLVTESGGHWKLMTGSPAPFFPTLDELVEYYGRSTELGGVALRPRDENGFLVVTDPKLHSTDGDGDELLERVPSVVVGAAQSPTFRKLASDISSCQRLFDLISLGNGILDAEENKLLFNGEMARLRRNYRIRRSVLSYGCRKESWQPNKNAKECQSEDCQTKFSTTTRRHHCRSCGQVMCKTCSSQRFERSGLKLAKVCPLCHLFLSEVATGRVKEAIMTYGPSFSKMCPKVSKKLSTL